MKTGSVLSVSRSKAHGFSKSVCNSVKLLQGLGVEGDAHCGATVKHRSRVARDPSQPNLRQVHLIQGELFRELREKGFEIAPGEMGENILTKGLDLLSLSCGDRLHVGDDVVLSLTGLRNPCAQLNAFQEGLTRAVLDTDAEGNLIRKAGVMSVVLVGGLVHIGDAIVVRPHDGPFEALERV